MSSSTLTTGVCCCACSRAGCVGDVLNTGTCCPSRNGCGGENECSPKSDCGDGCCVVEVECRIGAGEKFITCPAGCTVTPTPGGFVANFIPWGGCKLKIPYHISYNG